MAKDELMSITGKSHWAFVQSPDRKYQDQERDPKLGGTFRINVELTPEEEEKLRAADLGHLIRFQMPDPSKEEVDPGASEGYKYVAVKVRENWRDREDGTYHQRKKPKVVDANDNPITDLIGNGSEVEVLFRIYYSLAQKKKYLNLLKTTVLELVKYEPESSNKSDEETSNTGKQREATTGDIVE